MSLSAIVVAIVAALMIIGCVALILLWAFTEELPRMNERVPFYERLDNGTAGVRLLKVGRRHMRTMRLINEILGGDIGAAKAITENPPSLIVEGISEALAREIVSELGETGAVGEVFEV